MLRGWLPPLLILLLAGGLIYRQQASEAATEERQFLAFGTRISITLRDDNRTRIDTGLKLTEEAFHRWHTAWHAWEPSELTRLNAAIAAGQSATVSAELAELLRQAQALAHCSGGRFDPAIGGLLALWGFQSSQPGGQPPDPAALETYLARRPDMSDLQIDGQTISSNNPRLQLDLGAVAKGYAIDIAAHRLLDLGIDAFIINTGGDLRARAGTGRPWRIGIRDPAKPGNVLAVVTVSGDESIFTSGNYERFYEVDGRRYHHILDPRSGHPAPSVASATVIHRNATLADAAATALLVAGLPEWSEVAREMGLEQVLIIDSDGNAHATGSMASRLDWVTTRRQVDQLQPTASSSRPGCGSRLTTILGGDHRHSGAP
ncbi:MAG: FAD:protein FMN transferase [Gammaproteobacteria bacterium]|nr:FAD:protein FMN transferase [Gammaproteobacteria bacterium]